MSAKSLLIVGSSASAAGHAPVQRVLDYWPRSERPEVELAEFSRLLDDPGVLDHIAAAWIILDQPRPHGLFEIIALLQDRHIPAMLSRPHETKALAASFQEGIVIAPVDSPAEALYGVMRTLWNQASVFRSLRMELKIAQAQHGGLSDQFDRIDEELRLAAQLQRDFMPNRYPQFPDLDFQVLFRPAGYVSGDMYDVIRLDEQHVGLFVADAVGHGVPAALMTMFIKQCLITKKIDASAPKGYRLIPPDEALFNLNEAMLARQTGKVRFATAAYAILNCHTLELTLARGGHPFPFILRHDGSIETLEPEGPLLGVFPDEKFDVVHNRLECGDRLLMYSDGFDGLFSRDDAQGIDTGSEVHAYREGFRDLSIGPMDEALHRLATHIDSQAGSLHQRDDMTILAVGVAAQRLAPPVSSRLLDSITVGVG